MFILMLNPMRGRAEDRLPVARSDSLAELWTFLAAESVTLYTEPGPIHAWHKVFRKGGPLEWFNLPLSESDAILALDEHEIRAKWMQQVEDDLRRLMESWKSIPTVEALKAQTPI